MITDYRLTQEQQFFFENSDFIKHDLEVNGDVKFNMHKYIRKGLEMIIVTKPQC